MVKTTDHKAWGGLVGAVLATVAARAIVYFVPFLGQADYLVIHELAVLTAAAAIGYAATWWSPANKPKDIGA